MLITEIIQMISALNQAFITAKYKKYINLYYRGTQIFPVFIPRIHALSGSQMYRVDIVLFQDHPVHHFDNLIQKCSCAQSSCHFNHISCCDSHEGRKL